MFVTPILWDKVPVKRLLLAAKIWRRPELLNEGNCPVKILLETSKISNWSIFWIEGIVPFKLQLDRFKLFIDVSNDIVVGIVPINFLLKDKFKTLNVFDKFWNKEDDIVPSKLLLYKFNWVITEEVQLIPAHDGV